VASGELIARRVMRLSLLTLFVVMVSLFVVTADAGDSQRTVEPDLNQTGHGLADPRPEQNDPHPVMRAARGDRE
jgi:hypothetical protein